MVNVGKIKETHYDISLETFLYSLTSENNT